MTVVHWLRAIPAALFLLLASFACAASFVAEFVGKVTIRAVKRIDGPDGLVVGWVDRLIAEVELGALTVDSKGPGPVARDVEARTVRPPRPWPTPDPLPPAPWRGPAEVEDRTTHRGADIRHPGSRVTIRELGDNHSRENDGA